MSASGCSRANSAACENRDAGTITDAELTAPCFSVSMMAQFTSSQRPKSSALMIARRASQSYPSRCAAVQSQARARNAGKIGTRSTETCAASPLSGSGIADCPRTGGSLGSRHGHGRGFERFETKPGGGAFAEIPG